jgi:hypothetical protein
MKFCICVVIGALASKFAPNQEPTALSSSIPRSILISDVTKHTQRLSIDLTGLVVPCTLQILMWYFMYMVHEHALQAKTHMCATQNHKQALHLPLSQIQIPPQARHWNN